MDIWNYAHNFACESRTRVADDERNAGDSARFDGEPLRAISTSQAPATALAKRVSVIFKERKKERKKERNIIINIKININIKFKY